MGARLSEIACSQTASQQWSNLPVWLITALLLMGALAALTGIIDYAGDRRVRPAQPALPHMLLSIAVYVVQLVNVFVYSRDGWTAVVPTGPMRRAARRQRVARRRPVLSLRSGGRPVIRRLAGATGLPGPAADPHHRKPARDAGVAQRRHPGCARQGTGAGPGDAAQVFDHPPDGKARARAG
ncbi:MAG: DUF2231 domain-containing protein [Sphingomonadaceae bacterium]|nr:DUF2231 domain-containing protein [Sphingomonadaceae bacterium]